MSLVRRTIRAGAWTFGATQLTAALSFATSVLIAHFVSPENLGRYALASGIAALVNIASTFQADVYYIVADHAPPRLLRTGITIEFILGAILWICIAGIAAI